MPVPTSRRRLPPAQRRREILDVATSLIATSGFNGIPVGRFAEACGMTKAGLLHYFASKEDLLVAVLERRDELDAFAFAPDRVPATDAASSRALLTRLVRRNLSQPSIVQLYTVLSAEALDPSHPAHAYFAERWEASTRAFEVCAFPWHPQPRRCAIQVHAFLDGLQVTWLRDPSIDFEAEWNAFADRLYADRAPL
jgi:AcrR family transcriptional regulator